MISCVTEQMLTTCNNEPEAGMTCYGSTNCCQLAGIAGLNVGAVLCMISNAAVVEKCKVALRS